MSSIDPIRARFVGAYREKTDVSTGEVLERVPEEALPGIPARDLTEPEYQALTVEQRAMVRGSDLYEVKTDAEMKPAVKRAERAIERAAEQAPAAEGVGTQDTERLSAGQKKD